MMICKIIQSGTSRNDRSRIWGEIHVGVEKSHIIDSVS